MISKGVAENTFSPVDQLAGLTRHMAHFGPRAHQGGSYCLQTAPTTQEIIDGLLAIVRCLVDNKSAVHISVQETGSRSTFELHCDPDDVGKLLGKQGRTARALRTILGAMSQSPGSHQLHIVDPLKS
jgi:predicted RNA-binding protein YlqC (UPF0109 family)